MALQKKRKKRMGVPSPERGTPEYDKFLMKVGERIVEVNSAMQNGRRQDLTTTVIRAIEKEQGLSVGSFERKNFGNPEEKLEVWEDLVLLDERFNEIDVKADPRRQRKVQHLERTENFDEENFMEEIILETLDERSEEYNGGYLPKGFKTQVMRRVNTERARRGLPERTIGSINGYISRMFYGRENPEILKGVRGSSASQTPVSPDSKRKPYDKKEKSSEPEEKPEEKHARETLEERINDINVSSVDDEADDLSNQPGEDKDTKYKRRAWGRDQLSKYMSRPHTELLAYLIAPQNFMRLFSDNVVPVQIDLGPDCFPPEIYDEHKSHLKSLEDISHEDSEVSEFVSGWLRADVIFRRDLGNGEREYFVVEVKPNATRTSNGFDNAKKARQQLAAYRSVVLENVRMCNEEREQQQDSDEYVPIKEEVDGVLVSYEIEDKTRKHIARTRDTRAIQISKEKVQQYIQDHHQKTLLVRALQGYVDKRTQAEMLERQVSEVVEEEKVVEEVQRSYHQLNGFGKEVLIGNVSLLRELIDVSQRNKTVYGSSTPLLSVSSDKRTLMYNDGRQQVVYRIDRKKIPAKMKKIIGVALREGKIKAA